LPYISDFIEFYLVILLSVRYSITLLLPFPIGTVYADNNYAYKDRLPAGQLIIGKKNTQQIERDHLTLRTRIKRLCRKTICFSKNKDVHKAVVGTFINLFFFGRGFDASTILCQYRKKRLEMKKLLKRI